MKIIYFANTRDKAEQHKNTQDIYNALLKLGHEVILIDDRNFTEEQILGVKNPDLFLFHKGGVEDDIPSDFYVGLARLQNILINLKCKKAFWYLDKVWKGRAEWIDAVVPMVDRGFLTDETFLRRHNYYNLFSLKQGAPDDAKEGKFREEFKCEIAYIGTIYGERKVFVRMLSQTYGDAFRAYNNVFGQDFRDLCYSADIVIAPRYPADHFYWSDRIYTVLAANGFLFHPKLYGLETELKNKEHYVAYNDWFDLTEKIDLFRGEKNSNLRTRIADAGRREVMEKYTYSKRLKTLLENI